MCLSRETYCPKTSSVSAHFFCSLSLCQHLQMSLLFLSLLPIFCSQILFCQQAIQNIKAFVFSLRYLFFLTSSLVISSIFHEVQPLLGTVYGSVANSFPYQIFQTSLSVPPSSTFPFYIPCPNFSSKAFASPPSFYPWPKVLQLPSP